MKTYIKSDFDKTVARLIAAGYEFVIQGDRIYFEEPVAKEKLELLGVTCD